MAASEKEDPMRPHIECSVCFLPYNTSSKRPKNLSCGHTFCAECLNKLHNVQTSTISCPQDREQCSVQCGDVDKLPNNFVTLNLLENYCGECMNQLKERPCFTDHCGKVLCTSCRANHCEGFHSIVKTSLLELKQETSRLLLLSDDDVELTQMLEEADHVVAVVTRVCDDLKKKIIDTVTSHVEQKTDKFVEWKTSLAQETIMARSFVDKTVPRLGSSYKATKSDEVLVDAYQLAVKKKEELLEQERAHPEFLTFDIEALQDEFEQLADKLLGSFLAVSFLKQSASAESRNTANSAADKSTNKPYYKQMSCKTCFGNDGSGTKVFDEPYGISISTMGYIAITDVKNHRIHILKDTLEHVTVFGSKGTGENQYDSPRDVTFNSSGLLFIVDTKNNRIQVTDITGKFLRMFGSKGSGPAEFQAPAGIISTGGLLYICDSDNYRVKVTKEDGSYVRVIDCKGHKPWFLAASKTQDKLVVSDYGGNLHFFTCAGSFLRTMTNKPPLKLDALGVAIDQQGNTIVTDYSGCRLLVLGPDYQVVISQGAEGDGPGHLKKPCGVAITRDGDIVVCERNNQRIQLFNVPQYPI